MRVSPPLRAIALAKSKYEDGNNNDDLLKTSQDTYELCVAQYGEKHELTIHAGRKYAICLQSASRRDYARDLLTKLLITSKQVLGPHHSTTKAVASAFSVCQLLFG